MSSSSQRFSYESLLNTNEHEYLLNLEIPFMGSELIKLNYASKTQISGRFYERLLGEIKKQKSGPYFLNLFNHSLEAFSIFFREYEKILNDKDEKSCQNGKCESLFWRQTEDDLFMDLLVKEGEFVYLRAHFSNDNILEEVKMSFSQRGEELFSLELYPKSCAL